MKKEVQITVVGKVWKANAGKILALNECLEEYFGAVKFFLSFASTSKTYLHRNGYEEARRLFDLNTALIQTARDKAVEVLKSFEKNKKDDSVLRLKRVSMRFDKRCYRFSKTTNVLTPYWLTLSLNRRKRVSLPLIFGERQEQRIEEALRGEWEFTTVEMVKRNGEWYAHFVLKKVVEVPDEPEAVIAIDRGEHNLAVAVAISKDDPGKPVRGRFWRGEEIKRIRGLYGHIRRKLQKKNRVGMVKELRGKEKRKVDQQLHIIANQIIAYAKQFPKPVIVMENLNGIRSNFKKSKELNRRFHSLPFRKLQAIVEYKALLAGIEVKYLTKKEVKNTSRKCHRCGHVARSVRGREFKCPKCGMIYNRDLNAAINIAHALTRRMGWGRREAPELADVGDSGKLPPNARSSRLQPGEPHVVARRRTQNPRNRKGARLALRRESRMRLARSGVLVDIGFHERVRRKNRQHQNRKDGNSEYYNLLEPIEEKASLIY